MSYERFLECDYLDSQLQPASQMLRRCVQDPSLGLELSCTDKSKYLQGDISTRGNITTMKPNLMDSLSIQRGHEMGIEENSVLNESDLELNIDPSIIDSFTIQILDNNYLPLMGEESIDASIISLPGDIFLGINLKFLKHALEWDYFLGVITFYLLTFLMWKKN